QCFPGVHFERNVFERLYTRFRIGEGNVIKHDISFQFSIYTIVISNVGPGFQEFINPFLGGSGTLNERVYPSKRHRREGELIDIDHKVFNVSRRYRTYDNFLSANIDGQNSAETYKKKNQVKENGLRFNQRNGRVFIAFALLKAIFQLPFFAVIALNNPDSR